MKSEGVLIGGAWFEYMGTMRREDCPNARPEIWKRDPNRSDEIYLFYKRPSDRKTRIWFDWCYWAKRYDGELHIRSANCNFFSIEGFVKVRTNNYKEYYVTITYAHCRAWEIV